MALIDRITKLKHPGTLKDFAWPPDLPAFGRYNLIYGWNGSGKTTISRLFRFLEMQSDPQNCEVEFSIDGKGIRGPDFKQAIIPVRTFNRDYVSTNVFQSSGEDVSPILVLGEDSIQNQAKLEELKASLRKAKSKQIQLQQQQASTGSNLDRHCIHHARLVKEALRATGQNPYNNYNKADYQKRAREMMVVGDRKLHLLKDSTHVFLISQIHASPEAKIDEIDYTFSPLSEFSEDVRKLLETSVVVTAIKSLQDDQYLSSWVHEGTNLHKMRNADRCLFCEQILPQDRLANLEAHFSAEYERLLAAIDSKIELLEQVSKSIDSAKLPHRSQFYEDLGGIFGIALEKFYRVKQKYDEALVLLGRVLTEKKGRLFESVDLDVSLPALRMEVTDDINKVVRTHNVRCDEFESLVANARNRLADDMVAGSLDEYGTLVREVGDSELEAASASEEVERLAKEISQLELEISDHRRPAAELNEDLRKYLGHGELQLTVKETGYEITRNGDSAQSLSEGEITAIALLYFLKSLDDMSFDVSNGVVVLDDPVSSLDSNALFLAFGLIRERTQDAGQVFILTHNFTFFRNVKSWLHNMPGQRRNDISKRPARLYMLELQLAGNTSQRHSTLRSLDPLLEWYESEYHYLFSRIYQESQKVKSALSENYVLPNMARRLLEGFLAFRMPQISGELWRKLKSADFDEATKTRILRFVHTHSHNDVISEPAHDPSLLAEAGPVLQDLLTFIRTLDPDHYSAMEELVNRPSAEDEE